MTIAETMPSKESELDVFTLDATAKASSTTVVFSMVVEDFAFNMNFFVLLGAIAQRRKEPNNHLLAINALNQKQGRPAMLPDQTHQKQGRSTKEGTTDRMCFLLLRFQAVAQDLITYLGFRLMHLEQSHGCGG